MGVMVFPFRITTRGWIIYGTEIIKFIVPRGGVEEIYFSQI